MTHLGDLISALVDGELDGIELDRANAHLAACAGCRAEAAALRLLKCEMRALREAEGDAPVEAFNVRLLALAGPPVPIQVPARYLQRERGTSTRPRRLRVRAGQRRRSANAGQSAPPGTAADETPNGRHRGRYAVWGAVSLVVMGIGGAAFGMGGGPGSAGGQAPKITPQLVEFDLQHAINAGDVPFADPSESTPSTQSTPVKDRSRIPVGATTP